jgi:hydrogenase nickel incorporation protein HypA/HybF
MSRRARRNSQGEARLSGDRPVVGVEIEALRFGFDVVMRDSIAEARRSISSRRRRRPGAFPANTIVIGERYDPCSEMRSHQLQVTGGEELRIKELEVN